VSRWFLTGGCVRPCGEVSPQCRGGSSPEGGSGPSGPCGEGPPVVGRGRRSASGPSRASCSACAGESAAGGAGSARRSLWIVSLGDDVAGDASRVSGRGWGASGGGTTSSGTSVTTSGWVDTLGGDTRALNSVLALGSCDARCRTGHQRVHHRRQATGRDTGWRGTAPPGANGSTTDRSVRQRRMVGAVSAVVAGLGTWSRARRARRRATWSSNVPCRPCPGS
jgi:hypothetical protein